MLNGGDTFFEGRSEWLEWLSADFNGAGVDGLVPVNDYEPNAMRPEEVAIMEKAAHYQAQFVFFEASRNNRASTPQAFVYVSDGSGDDREFAALHRRLWSWGGVPLLYRKLPGKVDLLRCASKPDFEQGGEVPKYNPYKTFSLASEISQSLQNRDAWWNSDQLRNGTLWDDPENCKSLLSDSASAHRHLVDNIFALYKTLTRQKLLSDELQRRLLILTLLIAYLDERKALEGGYFSLFLKGARSFPDVLRNGPALIKLLSALEERFNGHVFQLENTQREELERSQQLGAFADLIEGRHDAQGQGSFWRLYSFRDLPVELISSIYQLFVEDKSSSIYTPPALVRLMLEEALSWERIDRLIANDEAILDPACGSGVYLVEAYKRLILHWRIRNNWRRPKTADLKALLSRVYGIDLEAGAIKLAAFSLCLALCEALEPEHIRKSVKLFPVLEGETLHASCFFLALEEGRVRPKVGVVVGNPPFKSKLSTPAAARAAKTYAAMYGEKLPDTQLAYLFLVCATDLLADGGVISMIQPSGFLYNLNPKGLRTHFFQQRDVREILDFVSVRGLFARTTIGGNSERSGSADTKVIVVVAYAGRPDPSRKILHAVFRRNGRAEAKLGFEIDYYDMHWLPRETDWGELYVWRSGLLGGARVASFAARLARLPTLGDFSKARRWNAGEGFIPASGEDDPTLNFLFGQPLLPTSGLGPSGVIGPLETVDYKAFESPRSMARFTAPLLLIKEHMDLHQVLIDSGIVAYKNEIVGFAAPASDIDELEKVQAWIENGSAILRAYVATSSIRLFNIKATAIGLADIMALPYSNDADFTVTKSEAIIADDIVEYMRDLVRLGEKSRALKESGFSALPAFADTFLEPINTIYSDKHLIPHPAKTWPGIICQPFSFGPAEVNWSNMDEFRGWLEVLLEKRNSSLSITRIARIYDGNMLFLIKPDRLRFWLRSVALRDADEVLADLRAQGF